MTLHTRIPIEKCKARLASGVDAERFAFSWSGYGGSRTILGKLRDTGFRFQKRRYYHNSFAPFFFGRFVASDSGTLIEGEFRMHPFVKVFMIAWFSFLAVSTVIVFVSVIAGRADVQGNPALGLGIPAGMAAFGVALVKFGRWLSRGEERAIVAFLKSTLEANDAA
jgi:hypothetical protein